MRQSLRGHDSNRSMGAGFNLEAVKAKIEAARAAMSK
jgi:hypothetical protein